jgi:hypothetical protein
MRTLSVFEYGQVEPLTRTEKNLLDQLRGPCDERLFEAGWRETRATSFVGGAPGGRALPARLAVLKGRWLVAAQAGRPDGWRRDRFDVAYDEFTEDNLPNRLFKATVHRLFRWSQWTNTRLRGRSHFGAAKARRHLTQLRAAEVATDSHGCSPIESVSHLCLSVANVPLPGRAKTFAFLFDPPNKTADKHEPTLRGIHRRIHPPRTARGLAIVGLDAISRSKWDSTGSKASE